MKRSFGLVLFVFCVSIFLAGCSCFPCGQVAEAPCAQPVVATPAPAPPPAPQYVPPPKADRN